MDRRGALRCLAGTALACAGGTSATAAADGALPSWLPPPGMRRNVGHNVLADVDPCPARNCTYSGIIGQRAVIDAWCGAAFASGYGRLGAWVTTGGGHGDYYGNEAYAFELDTLRWVRLNEPYPGGPGSIVDYSEGEYAPGIPLSSHTYQHTQYLPPSLGGGPKGSLLLVVSYAAGKLAKGSGRAHACDLATGKWTRYSANKASVRVNATSSTCVDAARGRIWRIPYGGAQVEYLDLAERTFKLVSPGGAGGNNFGVDHTCAHDPERDLILVLDWRRNAAATLWGLELAAPGPWRALPTEGAPPTSAAQGMALEWCPPLRCFVGYQGGGATFVHKLVPPAGNALASPWQWQVEEVGGDAPIGRSKAPRMTYSRFRFAPAIASFVWVDDHKRPAQVLRLPAARAT